MSNRWAIYMVAGCLLWVLGHGDGWAQAPDGPEFQVDTLDPGYPVRVSEPGIAATENGSFVIVWESDLDPGPYDFPDAMIYGRHFDDQGVPSGAPFVVSEVPVNDASYPEVAFHPSGNFLVVWGDPGSGIQGRRFSPTSLPLGDAFQINESTAGIHASVAGNDDAIVVVWDEAIVVNNQASYATLARRYAHDGTAIGDPLMVRTYATSHDFGSRVAVDDAGDFVVVWSRRDLGGDNPNLVGIEGRRFASSGTPQGPAFRVNVDTFSDQFSPDVARAANGDFVVAWFNSGSEGGYSTYGGIRGQRFASDGAPLGGEIQVNSYTPSSQARPAVSMGQDGKFTIVWQSFGSPGSDGSSNSMQGQVFQADGTPFGSQFQVNTLTQGSQDNGDVAMDASGNFIVTWQDGLEQIQGQRFVMPMFTDGFESGDTAAWSTAVP